MTTKKKKTWERDEIWAYEKDKNKKGEKLKQKKHLEKNFRTNTHRN